MSLLAGLSLFLLFEKYGKKKRLWLKGKETAKSNLGF